MARLLIVGLGERTTIRDPQNPHTSFIKFMPYSDKPEWFQGYMGEQIYVISFVPLSPEVMEVIDGNSEMVLL